MIAQVLEHVKEPLPKWLADYPSIVDDKELIHQILTNRVLYYPGSYEDGQPIKLFNQLHTVHTYFYVDYLFPREKVTKSFLKGYRILDTKELSVHDLYNPEWIPLPIYKKAENWCNAPYCILQVYEREDGYGDEHGCERLAVIFLCKDAIASYHAIFTRPDAQPPYVMVIQDHGFGCNYDRFGRNGLLENIANVTGVKPKWILNGSSVWGGYRLASDEVVHGGMWLNKRQLYVLENRY